MDLSIANSVPTQLTSTADALAQPSENGVASQAPTGEHAARLRSQASLTTTQTASSSLTAMALHSADLPAMVGSGRIEHSGASSQAAVDSLNLIPVVVTALHVASSTLQQRPNEVPSKPPKQQKKAADDQHQDESDKQQAGDEEIKLREQAGDHNTGEITGFVEPNQQNQHRGLFAAVLKALVRGEQTNMIRQLQGTRRIVVIFPVERLREQKCAAQACMVWRDVAGMACVARFAAQLSWPTRKPDEPWLTVRAYKDRAAHHQSWHLRVQPVYPPRSSTAIQMGTAPLLPGLWKDSCVTIPGAPRFWSMLGSQFSLQFAISAMPLEE